MRSQSSVMRRRLGILAVLLASALAEGGLYPRLSEESVHIGDLLPKSSMVCKGEVTSAPPVKTITGPLPRSTGTATIRVDRCFKGQSAGQIRVASDEYRPAAGWGAGGHIFTPEVGEYLLLFLKTKENNTYELADAYSGALPVSRNMSTVPKTGDPYLDLEHDLEAGLNDPDPEMVLRSVCWLGTMAHLESNAPLHALLAKRGDSIQRAYIWETLLNVRDLSVVADVAKALNDNPPVKHDFFLPADRFPYMQLRLYMAFCRLRDPKAIPYLESFARSPNARMRVEAIQSLRAIGSLDSAPVFLKALDDNEEDIGFIAMQSLFELAGQGPDDFGPAYVDSGAKPEVHPARIRQWWEEEGEAEAKARATNSRTSQSGQH